MHLCSGKPLELRLADKARFIAFVAAAGEVDRATLPGLVEAATALVMLLIEDALVGTAAIKTPFFNHRRGEFAKAGVPGSANDFPLELGWVVVDPAFRKRGYARMLVEFAVRTSPDRGIYATTKTQSMRAILKENGFEELGDPYLSALNPLTKLSLFGRHPDH